MHFVAEDSRSHDTNYVNLFTVKKLLPGQQPYSEIASYVNLGSRNYMKTRRMVDRDFEFCQDAGDNSLLFTKISWNL